MGRSALGMGGRRFARRLAAFEFPAQPTDIPPGLKVEGPVWIHPSVRLPCYGSITGPTYLAANCELGGRGSSSAETSLRARLACSATPASSRIACCWTPSRCRHFSYVGTACWETARLGAGAICSNLRLEPERGAGHPSRRLPPGFGPAQAGRAPGATGRKRAAMAVLNPGSILGRRALVMPGMSFRGSLPADSVAFVEGAIRTRPSARRGLAFGHPASDYCGQDQPLRFCPFVVQNRRLGNRPGQAQGFFNAGRVKRQPEGARPPIQSKAGPIRLGSSRGPDAWRQGSCQSGKRRLPACRVP